MLGFFFFSLSGNNVCQDHAQEYLYYGPEIDERLFKFQLFN